MQRLWANEGRCVHRREVTIADPVGKQAWEQAAQFCPPIELAIYMTTTPVGREVESADVLINGHPSNLAQLALLADAITELTHMHLATAQRLGESPST